MWRRPSISRPNRRASTTTERASTPLQVQPGEEGYGAYLVFGVIDRGLSLVGAVEAIPITMLPSRPREPPFKPLPAATSALRKRWP